MGNQAGGPFPEAAFHAPPGSRLQKVGRQDPEARRKRSRTGNQARDRFAVPKHPAVGVESETLVVRLHQCIHPARRFVPQHALGS